MKQTKNGRRIALLSGVVFVAVIAAVVWVKREEIRSQYIALPPLLSPAAKC
jgi:hypothetical protein